MSTEERAEMIRHRMRTDMNVTLGVHLPELVLDPDRLEGVLDALVDDGMFHVEQLLTAPGDL